ncbi:hypothetical protein [Rhodoferax sp.]
MKKQLNLLIDWIANGGQRHSHSSAVSALVSSNHRQRWASQLEGR